jgi:hypothetical protein
MTNVLHLPIADSNLNGGGLRPAVSTQRRKIGKARPDSNLGLAGAVTIATWPKNGRKTLMVRLELYKSHAVIDARNWYVGANGKLKPGRSGLTLTIKHLPQLADALAKALALATERGLICQNGGGA